MGIGFMNPARRLNSRRSRGAARWAMFALGAWGLLGVSGCALQADVMEMSMDVDNIRDLQAKLEQQLAEASTSADKMRALKVRVETLEDHIRQGVGAELEAKVGVELKAVERARKDMMKDALANDRRLNEAETFFIERVKSVSSRQQGLDLRMADLEAQVDSVFRGRAADAEDSARRVAAAEKAATGAVRDLAWVDDRFTAMTDRLALLEGKLRDRAKDGRVNPADTEGLWERLELQGEELKLLRGQLNEALARLEVEKVRDEIGRMERHLAESLQNLEVSVAERTGAQTAEAQGRDEALLGKIKALDGAVSQRLMLMEQRLDEATAQAAQGGPEGQETNQKVDQLAGAVTRKITQMDQRIEELSQQAAQGTGGDVNQALVADLAATKVALEQRLAALESGPDPAFVADLSRRLDALENRPIMTLPEGTDNAQVGELVAGQVQSQLAMLEASLGGRLARLEAMAAEAPAPGAAVDPALLADIDQRMGAIETRLKTRQQNAIPAQVVELVAGQVTMLEAAIDERFTHLAQEKAAEDAVAPEAVTDLRERLAAMEAQLERPRESALPAQVVELVAGQVAVLEQEIQDRLNAAVTQAGFASESGTATWTALSRRVAEVEARLAAAEAGPVESQVPQQVVELVSAQVSMLEQEIDQRLSDANRKAIQAGEAGAETWTQLSGRVAALEAGQQTASAGPSSDVVFGLVAGQVAALEADMVVRMEATARAAAEDAALKVQAEAPAQVADTAPDVEALIKRVEALEQALKARDRETSKSETSDIERRLGALEGAGPDPALADGLNAIGERIGTLEGELKIPNPELANGIAQVSDRLETVALRIDTLEATQVTDTVELRARFDALAQALSQLNSAP